MLRTALLGLRSIFTRPALSTQMIGAHVHLISARTFALVQPEFLRSMSTFRHRRNLEIQGVDQLLLIDQEGQQVGVV
eukprot:EC717883.1.p1 GENE.EC717883.1~~EC717883.1.p1  ORF type:complete len:77 (+),score=8.88 EC717883.1:95-325(+)